MAGKVSPIKAGLACRCPACGEGPVFKSFLEIAPRCTACGADFSKADAGDGPAFFVMFILAIIIMPPVLLVQIVFAPPVWVHAILWTPLIVLLGAWLLRPFKSIMFALQWKHNAADVRWTGSDGHSS
ncbi:MAG TPA: DUF983 domain-containing protein [Henriciella marina]|uniref:DUF983 domain-containing protein n=1 Tax=Henriciella sp. TaxID=1968823 RepID=UPI00183EA471|nr:DUF983 domain-containing protein [Henriciella sp.]HIG23026.1 DUF983 domain-containing protein [Henriciella sp.]HIK66234.1 DUF983 domain-containing protein [Henriciella marina]